MGYVFDALNRGDDDPRQDTADGSPSAQPPGDPSETPVENKLTDEVNLFTASKSSAHEVPVNGETPYAEDEEAPIFNFSEARASSSESQSPDTAVKTPFSQPPVALRLSSEWSQNLDDRLVLMTEPSSQLAEEYRGIRTTLLARWEHRRHLVHTITSATPQEGKTITSLNLGLSLAELRNRKTVVLEADLRLPTFNKLLHLGQSKGMIGYLRGEAELGEVIQDLEGTPMHIITAGSRASNDAVQLLSNTRMAKLLDVLRTKYDHVIIDTPPVIELADAGILGGISDEVMLIARISRTPKPLIEQALRALRSYNAPVAGVIATDQIRSRNRYHYYRYGYKYRYRYYAKRAA